MAYSRAYTEMALDAKGRDVAVWVNGADVTGKVGTEEEALLHELVHAATAGALLHGSKVAASPHARAAKAIYEAAGAISEHISRRFEQAAQGKATLTSFEQDMRDGHNNAFRGMDEVVAWALTNREAQQYLDGIPYQGGQTLWTRFVQAVRSFLGLEAKADSVLSEVLAAAEQLMDATDTTLPAVKAFWHKRGLPMITQQAAGSYVTRQPAADHPEDADIAHMGAPTHGYLDGKPYNPPTEQLSAEQRKLIVDTFNANTSGEKVTTTGAVESSGDIGAKSRAFQALAAAEGWTVHRDQIGAKYFNVNKGGRDGINIAVRVSDHSNVNRGIHFKESAINLAPNDGRAAFDDFESALWKLRNAGEDEDGNLTFGGDEPDYFFGAADMRELKDSAINERKTVIAGQTSRAYTPQQQAAMQNVGFQVEQPSLKERAQALWQDAGKKLAQGIVDQFAPVKEISKDAYALLRLS